MASVERLYELYNIINEAKDAGSKHEAEYEEILTGVKGSSAERRLSSQFIARFFSMFPNQQEQALNSQFDLCEDEELSIRKQATKDLPSFCKSKLDVIPKVADILAQLMQMEDSGEILTIQNSLVSLFKLDAKGTLTGLFYQIENSEDEVVRERCMRFLQAKIKSLGQEVFKTDAEELILKESKTVLQDASEEEFLLMMGILKELKVTKSLKGYQQMVDIVAEQCDLTQTLDPADLESMHRLSSCLKQAVPYFSSQIHSTKFVDYMCREVIPYINQLDTTTTTTTTSTTTTTAVEGGGATAVAEGGGGTVVEGSSTLALDLLRTLAELISYVGNLEEKEEKLNTVFGQLLECMPLPPDTTPDTAPNGTTPLDAAVSLEFSRVECLLYTFHKFAKQVPEFLAENQDRLKDFRIRLQYFARGSHAYQKKLREALGAKKEKKKEEEKKEEEKEEEEKNDADLIKTVALKTTANINTLIKDLFHTPPSYKSHITLSWKCVGPKGSVEKRHTPITFEGPSPNKAARTERQIYAPPRDKYSRGAGQFGRGRGGRGRGGFRGYGNFRGAYKRF